MSIAETTLSLTLDAGVTDAILLLACLTNAGFCVSEAMLATRDAVHCGLVKHA
jgi:hypothetical protein